MRLLTATVLACALALPAAAEIKFSGDAQYRLRYEWTRKDAVPGDTVKADITNRYSWSLKAEARPRDNLAIGLKLSNPSGNSTDNITDNLKVPAKESAAPVAIREAYFRWDVWVLSVSAGLIAHSGNTVLELAACEDKRYAGVGTDPWSTLANNAIKGLDVRADLVKSDRWLLGAEFLAAVGVDAGATLYQPDRTRALDQWKLMLAVPVDIGPGRITLTPTGHIRTAIAQSADGTESDHAFSGGLDLSVPVGKALSVTLGFAGGGYSNESLAGDTSVAQISPAAILGKVAMAVKLGPGKLQACVTAGQWQDETAAPGNRYRLVFGSLKYGVPVKFLTIEPWVRLWHTQDNFSGLTQLRVRAELSLVAAF